MSQASTKNGHSASMILSMAGVPGLRLGHDPGPDHVAGQFLDRARRIRIVADEIAAAVAQPDERPHQLDVGVGRGGVPAVGAAARGGAVVPEPLRVALEVTLGQFQRHATASRRSAARGATMLMALSRRFISCLHGDVTRLARILLK